MAKNKKEKIESIILASSHYLFEDLPNNFHKWSEKKIHKYCNDHAWQPFEFFKGSEIYEHINRLADDFIWFKKQERKK
tara:strand:+ start:842 stop:1075 length:234 start_codon:yes stop_codon:yes gene_type:complete